VQFVISGLAKYNRVPGLVASVLVPSVPSISVFANSFFFTILRHVDGPTHLVGRKRIRHHGSCSRVADCRAEPVRDGQRLTHIGAFTVKPRVGGTK
jgi:hypothetical protein